MIEDGSKMFGISTTPSSSRSQPFSYASQPPNINSNLNGLAQPPASQISLSSSSAINSRNYNAVNSSSSNYPQQKSQSSLSSPSLIPSGPPAPARINNNMTNASVNRSSNPVVFARPEPSLRNGHSTSVPHKHEVSFPPAWRFSMTLKFDSYLHRIIES